MTPYNTKNAHNISRLFTEVTDPFKLLPPTLIMEDQKVFKGEPEWVTALLDIKSKVEADKIRQLQ